MKPYTISKLAEDAGVSTSIVRDYQLRGIIKPSECMDCGYGVYDDTALDRLRFVRAGKAAGVSLDVFAQLCQAIDQLDRRKLYKMRDIIETILDDKRHHLETFKHKMQWLSNSKERH